MAQVIGNELQVPNDINELEKYYNTIYYIIYTRKMFKCRVKENFVHFVLVNFGRSLGNIEYFE